MQYNHPVREVRFVKLCYDIKAATIWDVTSRKACPTRRHFYVMIMMMMMVVVVVVMIMNLFIFYFFFQFFQSKDKVHRPRAINEQHEPDNKANKKHLQQLPLYITMSPTWHCNVTWGHVSTVRYYGSAHLLLYRYCLPVNHALCHHGLTSPTF